MSDRRSGGDVVFDTVEIGERDASQVEDCTVGFDGVADGLRTSGEALCHGFFVFKDETSELTFSGGDCIESFNVELAKTLDIQRTTVLIT